MIILSLPSSMNVTTQTQHRSIPEDEEPPFAVKGSAESSDLCLVTINSIKISYFVDYIVMFPHLLLILPLAKLADR